MFEIGFPCDPGQVIEMLQFGRILALYYWQEEKCHLRRWVEGSWLTYTWQDEL